uniref:Uncharacterized protein n=1 Tax=Cyprinus carpio TaxID=7962 RepID=A0A8C2G9S5_CYPCA
MDIRTLNKLSDLKETKFGQPPPRHGLSLLWWFAHDCVRIDSNGHMTAQLNPGNRAVGFKRFYNREKILLYTSLKYYTVGNLRTCGSLPKYVTKNYTRHSKKSNTDRIIVSFNSGCNRFENIYVTQHSDRVKFDRNRTYCISTELIKDIQDLSREDFLSGCTNHSEHISIDIHQSVQGETCQNIIL